MSSMGALMLTVAWMSQPPAALSESPTTALKASVRIDITIKVKMTKANIARVRPVRNLAAMG